MTVTQSLQWAELVRRSWQPHQWFWDDRRPAGNAEDKIMWVYMGGPGEWRVGFYAPTGEWMQTALFVHEEAAAKRVHYLNGGNHLDG